MKNPSVAHGTFTIERTLPAPPARVFAAWTDIETKALWFIGPAGKWKVVKREMDFRVGGSELLHGEFAGGHASVFAARYYAIIPNECIVYVYDMYVGDKHLSVSLATVEFAAAAGGGTRMTFTEQAAFLDGEDGVRSREQGTAAHLDRLALVLDDPREIVSARVFDAPRDLVFQAFSDPHHLAQWWGPKGFTNTFHEFDLRPGGAWRFVMRGPDGTEYAIAKEFIEVVAPERIVLRHVQPMHGFKMTITFVEMADETQLVWRMAFESEQTAEVLSVIVEANEQNFDRLQAHLGLGASRG
jgi:uncharacterized protein YndB with AHSA1/START domain